MVQCARRSFTVQFFLLLISLFGAFQHVALAQGEFASREGHQIGQSQIRGHVSRELLMKGSGKSDPKCKELRTAYDSKDNVWVIDDTSWEEVAGKDLQTVVDCTREGDTVYFATKETIVPIKTTTIKWNLTLSKLPKDSSPVLSETKSKTKIECPNNQSLFDIQADVLLINLKIQGCSLSSRDIPGVIIAGKCPQSGGSRSVEFRHVLFKNNKLDGAAAVYSENSKCFSINMNDVKFVDNECNGFCFGRLGGDNHLHKLVIKKNRRIEDEGETHSSGLLYLSKNSKTTVDQSKASENSITSICVDSAELEISNSILTDNTLRSVIETRNARRVDVINCDFSHNGGIGLVGAAIRSNNSDLLKISGCNFKLNMADSGGAIYSINTEIDIKDSSFADNRAYGNGGGVYLSARSLNAKGVVFTNNSASNSGGSVYLANVNNLSLVSATCTTSSAGSKGGCIAALELDSLAISSSSFLQNNAIIGGAISADRSTSVILDNTKLEMNKAEDGGAICIEKCARAVIDQCTAKKNSVVKSGGALKSISCQSLSITNTVFRNNVASKDGGGLYIDNSNFTAKSIQLVKNSAAGSVGGGISLKYSQVDISDSTFRRNKAENGGGLDVEGGTATVTKSTFEENIAFTAGGSVGVYVAYVNLHNCDLLGNEAPIGGGIDSFSSPGLLINNTRFIANFASENRGGGTATYGCHLQIFNSVWMHNQAADSGGGLHMVNTKATGEGLAVEENEARSGSGGLGMAVESSVKLSRSRFFNNTAEAGGSIDMHSSTLMLEKSEVKWSRAKKGAGMFVNTDSTATFVDVDIELNAASESGGGMFVKEAIVESDGLRLKNNTAEIDGGAVFSMQNSKISLKDSEVVDNFATRGGGFFAEDSTAVELDNVNLRRNSAGEEGGGGYVEDGSISTKRSKFWFSRAHTGGSLHVKNSSVEIHRTVFEKDFSELEGGSLLIAMESRISMSESSIMGSKATTGGAMVVYQSNMDGKDLTVVDCSADQDGGGIYVAKNSSFHCRGCHFESNTAVGHGGGVAIDSPYPQIRAFKFADSNFYRNTADLGGGLHMITPYEAKDCLTKPGNCSLMILADCRFTGNQAVRAGGGFFTRDPTIVRYSCQPDEKTSNTLSARDTLCKEWLGNSAGIYGPDVASYARHAQTKLGQVSERILYKDDGSMEIKNHKSGEAIPEIIIEVRDGLNQGPSLGNGDEFIDAALYSDNGFIPDQIGIALDKKRKRFSGIVGYHRPGNYSLTVDFRTEILPKVSIKIELRKCIVGEMSQSNDTLCIPCIGSQYNFHPNNSTCQVCPVDANCESSFIQPLDGHWHMTPCSVHVQECLSEEACRLQSRSELLSNTTMENTNCNFTEKQLEDYSSVLCSEGYLGVLCGSCEKGYGRSQSRNCAKCRGIVVNVIVTISSVLIVMGLVSFTIKSNLSKIENHKPPSLARQGTAKQGLSVSYLFTRSPKITARDIQLQSDPGSSNGSIERANSLTESERGELAEWAKDQIVEIFKITINFVQTIAVAISINIRWTKWMIGLFSTSDVVGGGAVESMNLSLDCIFGSIDSIPRSVLSTALFVFVPVFIAFVFCVFWSYLTFANKDGLAYWTKRCLLSVLAVSYLTYVSMTKSGINILYCVEVHDSTSLDEDSTDYYWALDTSVKCFKGTHAILTVVVGLPIVVLFSIGFPVGYCWIFARKTAEELEEKWLQEATGFLHRAYRLKFIYWESIIMLRKAILTLVVVYGYPLGGNLQGILAVVALLVALYGHVYCRPFREELDGLNEYEGVSLLVSCLTFACGLFFNDQRTSEVFRMIITALLFAAILGLLLFFVLMFAGSAAVYLRPSLQANGMTEVESWGCLRVIFAYLKLQLSQCRKAVATPAPEREEERTVELATSSNV